MFRSIDYIYSCVNIINSLFEMSKFCPAGCGCSGIYGIDGKHPHLVHREHETDDTSSKFNFSYAQVSYSFDQLIHNTFPATCDYRTHFLKTIY